MIDPKSKDFGNIIHNWCVAQRINESFYIMDEFDNLETRSTQNFYRNHVLNSQLDEAKSFMRIIKDNANKSKSSHFVPDEKHFIDANDCKISEQSNAIAHSLVQIQNQKLSKLYQKIDEISTNDQNNNENS